MSQNRGFTLIELIVGISVLAVMASVVVPTFTGYISMAKERVCDINCIRLERMYKAYLMINGVDHSQVVFDIYKNYYSSPHCPLGGELIYEGERVVCDIHITDISREDEDTDDEDNDEVPYL